MSQLDWSGVRLFAFDCDGVLTDGHVIASSDGVEAAVFSHRDGQGVEAVRKAGVCTVMISSQRSDYVDARGKKMQIDFFKGIKDKLECLKGYLKDQNPQITLDEVCFVGDDLSDHEVMSVVGYPAAPADAIAEIRTIAKHVTTRFGGHGAVREICDLIIEAKRRKSSRQSGKMILITGTGERTTAETVAAVEETAYRLALAGHTILTNSGRNGVPEAAAKGVKRARGEGGTGQSIAYAYLPDLTAEICGVTEIRHFDSFEVRNGAVCRDTDCAVFFQGGFGTLTKLFPLLHRVAHINGLMKGKGYPLSPKKIILDKSFATPDSCCAILGSTFTGRHLEALYFASSAEEIVALVQE